MNIKKEPGGVIPHTVSAEDLALINRLSKANLTAEQVYTFALRLCDNEVDRDWERFDEHGLEALSQLFTGKSGIFDHNWSAEGRTARLFEPDFRRGDGLTRRGERCRVVNGWC